MEKKLLIIHKLSFGEPTFFPQLEQLIKHRAFEHLCLQHTLSISALGGGRTEDYEDTGLSGSHKVEKLSRRGKKPLV